MVVKIWNYIWNMTFWGCMDLKLLPPVPSDAWNGGEILKLHPKHEFLGLYGVEHIANSAIRCLKCWWKLGTTSETWLFGVVWSWKYCHQRHQMPEMVVKFWNYTWNMTISISKTYSNASSQAKAVYFRFHQPISNFQSSQLVSGKIQKLIRAGITLEFNSGME